MNEPYQVLFVIQQDFRYLIKKTIKQLFLMMFSFLIISIVTNNGTFYSMNAFLTLSFPNISYLTN